MKQWKKDLIDLASTMPDTPDPSFNETWNFLRVVHNEQWDQLSSLNWSVLEPEVVFSLAVNVLKPEALLYTDFDWLTAQQGTSPVVRLLTKKSLSSFIALNAPRSRATYLAQKFWENPVVQKTFPFNTKVVADNCVKYLGDLALEWNAPSAFHFLKRTWNTDEEKTATWSSFFKMVQSTPLPSFTDRSKNLVFERADKIFDLLPTENPFGSPQVNTHLLQLAFATLVDVAHYKLEEQSVNRLSSDPKLMAIEMERFTLTVSEYIAQTLKSYPQLWPDMFASPSVERAPLAARVILGMLFQKLDKADIHQTVDTLVNKVVETNSIIWTRCLPTHPSIGVSLSDEQLKSILSVCSDYYAINWVCTGLTHLASPNAQEKLNDIRNANEKTNNRNISTHEKQQMVLERTALLSNFGSFQQPKIRKI